METNEFLRFIELAFSDGIITDHEKAILLKKANQLGIDEIEAELLIENYSTKRSENLPESATDDYDISDDELILRISNYSSCLGVYKATLHIDPFPVRLSNIGKVGSALNEGRKALNSITKSELISDSLGKAGSLIPIPGGKFIGKLAGKGVSSVVNTIVGGKKELKHPEIKSLCMSYLIILEKRKGKSEFLNEKYEEFKEKMRLAELNPPKKRFF